ncbi:Transcriptional regulator, ArsR family OS=Tsukamurella paurometabola (strain ATCC 8368 / DSM/ CCUG 35730 / CIP 100753 / JCM 10117 / KCTC 9821 / NBRC 16120/ NCIMB 702349 / NCTC 13040) OX=521096 GN=Tpau_1972 PE=4 SV=1 [Tsukamurella paurometabola]|uniref:Transcriptional regulator, ArsR family n=1 Tax=Tsukamurella paurometabola (strain ATCC 8368 / DSM 20162 / CCUG 35730 / CIP 100753 / JCM 10117 / KCTC 9821 / NBRC 16120 / NCIMB 702349 / NCTC 13040) TaxID=521096 RepID=D5UNL6_TSUPD|nr:metalloregulator ArsR/SmtB family transcription factor [Tsukamurella paurometabola]ADG78584.1 transcriptional regulator, ArsR family [Tsukamurella paurometabola DSM 20162]SUP32297.1 Transcriptional repressor smtB homolog [Tsukamurella paurometabola]
MAHGHRHGVDADAWAARFALLGDATRLRLLIAMHDRPGLGVGELAERAGVGQNAASQALRILRDAEWVSTSRDGRTVRYTLRSDAIVHRILHDILGVTHHNA